MTASPKSELLFCLAGKYSEQDVRALEELVASLAERSWALEPPIFVDNLDATSATRPGDLPIRTVGALLTIPAPDLSRVADEERALNDAEHMILALRSFTAVRQTEVELELDGVFVGDIQNGKVSQSVEQGLLNEWKRTLHSSRI